MSSEYGPVQYRNVCFFGGFCHAANDAYERLGEDDTLYGTERDPFARVTDESFARDLMRSWDYYEDGLDAGKFFVDHFSRSYLMGHQIFHVLHMMDRDYRVPENNFLYDVYERLLGLMVSDG